jgi:hypothetical protein
VSQSDVRAGVTPPERVVQYRNGRRPIWPQVRSRAQRRHRWSVQTRLYSGCSATPPLRPLHAVEHKRAGKQKATELAMRMLHWAAPFGARAVFVQCVPLGRRTGPESSGEANLSPLNAALLRRSSLHACCHRAHVVWPHRTISGVGRSDSPLTMRTDSILAPGTADPPLRRPKRTMAHPRETGSRRTSPPAPTATDHVGARTHCDGPCR